MQLGHGEEGGCPFKEFDDSNLANMMDIEQIVGPQREQISIDRQKSRFQNACKNYLGGKYALVTKTCSGADKVPDACTNDAETWRKTEKLADSFEEEKSVVICRCNTERTGCAILRQVQSRIIEHVDESLHMMFVQKVSVTGSKSEKNDCKL